MNEYQDQSTWFELWGFDGFQWEFVADFNTRKEGLEYAETHDLGYLDFRCPRRRGIL